VITQCSIRHLYLLKETPQPLKDTLVLTAKSMERRRCNHHSLDDPLSTLECLRSVIDPKDSLVNKNRYVVASQDEDVRRFCRGVQGVPLVYVKRSVMVMEPMAETSVGVREGVERKKFRSGIRGRESEALGKRKRVHEDMQNNKKEGGTEPIVEDNENAVRKKKTKGAKGPNPLSVKKPKKAEMEKKVELDERIRTDATIPNVEDIGDSADNSADVEQHSVDENAHPLAKRKRKRKHRVKKLEKLAASINEENEGTV